MFRAVLFTQWKWGRFALLALSLAAFALPLLSAQAATGAQDGFYWNTRRLLADMESAGGFYPILAGVTGLVLALTAWSSDHRGRHVYSLSLPITRWHYILLRFSAGAVLLSLPVVALLIGALIATAATPLPPGLQAYPLSMTLRYGLAVLVAYSVFFSIASGTSRTAGWVLGVIAGAVALQFIVDTLSLHIRILEPLLYRAYLWPGPLEIFVGRWMLFDV